MALDASLSDAQLLRYSRHILLNELGIEAQEKFCAATVLVIGVGGLGCPAALYLAAAGIGKLVLADPDAVDLTNLQRQILFRNGDVGSRKVAAAAQTLHALNPEPRIETHALRLQGSELDELVRASDIVLDCSDNFATRHAVNRAAVTHGRPLVSGAAVRFDGQIAVFDPRRADAPCYACLFPEDGDPEAVNCATMGVFAPVTGIVGAMQAAEALKCLADLPTTLAGRMLLLDGLSMQWHSVTVERDPECSVCRTRATAPA